MPAKNKPHADFAGFVTEYRNPLSGDWNVVLDCKRAEEEGNAIVADYEAEGGRYQVLCNKHGSIVHCTAKRHALTAAQDGTNFCDDCREAEKTAKRDASRLVGRLTPGTGYLGPEFSGCSNTGQRPMIRRPKAHNVPFYYLVGPEMECSTVTQTREGSKWYFSNSRSVGEGKQRVWKFKTRAPAIAKFQELCDAVWAFNDRVSAERAEAERRARSSDPAERVAGALALMDH